MANIPIGPGITAVRQPDIVVPLFDPSYVIDISGTPNRGFAEASLWPLIIPQDFRIEHAPAIVFLDAYAPGPFGYGRMSFNRSNSAASGTLVGNSLGVMRFGDILFAATENVKANAAATFDYGGYSVGTLFAGKSPANFDVNLSPSVGIIDWPETNMEMVSGAMIASATLYNHLEFGLIFESVNSSGKVYLQSFNPSIPGGLLSENIIDRGEIYNFVGQPKSLSFLSSIPSLLSASYNANTYGLDGLISWFAWDGTGTSPLYIQPFLADDFSAATPTAASPITLDDAALHSAFFGNPFTLQSTNFGFLIYNNSAGVGNYINVLLLSPDGTKYSMVTFRLLGTNVATWFSKSILSGRALTIDPTGIMYAIDNGSTGANTTVANSFALDIPWNPVALPINAAQIVTMPGLCGCSPVNFGA